MPLEDIDGDLHGSGGFLDAGKVQRATLHVPAPSPATNMSLGYAWAAAEAADWNSDGFCVASDGRIWLDANGGSDRVASIVDARDADAAIADSTFGALANGGQFLTQSLQDSIFMISNQSAIVATNGGAFLAGGGGVKLMAGHGTPILFGAGETPLENIKPDDKKPSSAHAKAYTDHMDEVAQGWTIADTVMAVALTAMDVGLTIADCYGGSSPGKTASTLLVLGSAANLAGGAVNIAGMTGSHLPGLNIHASSSITMATTGFCSIYSGAGMLLCGSTTTGIGFLTAGATASVSASLSSIGMTTVEGYNGVELTGMATAAVGSRTGPLKLYGAKMLFGSDLAQGGSSQLATATIEASAMQNVDLTSHLGDIEIETLGNLKHDAHNILVKGQTGVKITGPTYDVLVTPKDIKVMFSKTTNVTMDAKHLQAKAGSMVLKMTSQGIKVGGSAAKLDAKVGGIWNVKGKIDFL